MLRRVLFRLWCGVFPSVILCGLLFCDDECARDLEVFILTWSDRALGLQIIEASLPAGGVGGFLCFDSLRFGFDFVLCTM